MRVAPTVGLTPDQQSILEAQARSRSLPARVVERSRIVLLATAGKQDKEIARLLHLSRKKVSRWRKRFLQLGLVGLEKDAPRPGTPKITSRLIKRVVEMTTRQKPANAAHWSTRSMAQATGISDASLHRVRRAHGVKPHLLKTLKIGNDPEFADQLEDIVGFYLNPPEHALVSCVGENRQMRALDRTQPRLPGKPGRSQTMTRDYKRNLTATLFAALNTPNGKVYGLCQERHRHQEWLKFLRLLDQTTPAHLDLHLIADNYATHKHPKVQRWFRRHPRFHMHFIPTRASWLEMVEHFFRDLTQNRLRRGVFRDIEELITAIGDYTDRHNDPPKAFIWTARASDILERVKRARRALDKSQLSDARH